VGSQRDPQLLNRPGEILFVAVSVLGLVLSSAAMVGLGLACWVFGGGWVAPSGSDQMVTVLVGLLSGHPGEGLTPVQASRVPGPGPVYSCVGVCLVVIVALLMAVAAALASRYWRPGDSRRGMATRREAVQVLGVSRLRVAQGVIRPDLSGSETQPSEAPHRSLAGRLAGMNAGEER
jgi:hypothetical protein